MLRLGLTVNHLVTSSPPSQLLDGLREPLSQHHTGASLSKWTPCCRILVLVTVLSPQFTSLQAVTEHFPVSTGCSTGRAADSQKAPSLCLLGLRPDLHLGTTNYAPRRPQSKHSPPTLLSGQDESVIPAQSPGLQPHFCNRNIFSPDAFEGHTDLQLCVYEKKQAKRGTWPRSTELPNSISLFEIHKHPSGDKSPVPPLVFCL